MTDLHTLTATGLIERIRRGEIRAEEAVAASLRRIEVLEPYLSAWAWLEPEWALASARRIDAQIARGEFRGRLFGVPVGVKDIFNTADMPTEMGSRIWKGFQPGNDARVVFNIRYDGGVIVGKTKTSEFAVHEPTETRNPHHLEHAPGTSSAGSAAAVAAGMVPLALGSQTAGSTIRPASYCGVFGFKPTFGTVPRTGVLKTTDTLDTVAWFARSIDDVELLFEIVRVSGPNYPFVNINLARRPPPSPARIGLVRGPNWHHATDYAQRALMDCAERLDASDKFVVEEYELSEAQEIYDTHELIYCKALSYYFRGEERNDRTQISNVLVEMLDRGEAVSPEEYQRAVRRQAELTHQINSNFPHDAWITLSAGGEAPRGLRSRDRHDTCKIWTYLGMPVLSVPLFHSPSGLPVGLQIVGRKYSDYAVLDIARSTWEIYGALATVAEPAVERSAA